MSKSIEKCGLIKILASRGAFAKFLEIEKKQVFLQGAMRAELYLETFRYVENNGVSMPRKNVIIFINLLTGKDLYDNIKKKVAGIMLSSEK